MNKSDALDLIKQLNDKATSLKKDEIPKLIDEAIADGATWEEIGGAMNITRAAAHFTYSGKKKKKSTKKPANEFIPSKNG